MRFINVARRNLSQSNLLRQNFTELWKLATTSPINKSISKTKEEMSVVISSNLEPLFSKIYSNIEEIIKKEYSDNILNTIRYLILEIRFLWALYIELQSQNNDCQNHSI